MNEIQDISGAVRQKLDKNYARFLGLEVVAASPGAVTLALDHRAEFEFAPGYFEGVITSAVGQIAASYSGSSTSNLDWTHLVMQQSIRFVSPAFGATARRSWESREDWPRSQFHLGRDICRTSRQT